MNKKRIEWLDIARGICIFLMIICHACGSSGRWGIFNSLTGVFFLVFFFWSAGICFSGKRSLPEYIKRQFSKLIIPYTVVTSINLLYRIYHRRVHGSTRLIKVCNLILSMINARSNYFNIGPFESFGIGPVWFLVCLFFASIIYKIVREFKYRGVIIIVLMLIGSISGDYIILPFTIQSAAVGAMFIWIGESLKDKWISLADRFTSFGWIKSIIVGFLLYFVLSGTNIAAFWVKTYLGVNRYMDLGSNNYSVISLPASMAGFIFVMLLATTIKKIPVISEFMTFCGRETFPILILHNLDITMLRNWHNRGLLFMFSTLLIYPAIVYVYRIIEKNIKKSISIRRS